MDISLVENDIFVVLIHWNENMPLRWALGSHADLGVAVGVVVKGCVMNLNDFFWRKGGEDFSKF